MSNRTHVMVIVSERDNADTTRYSAQCREDTCQYVSTPHKSRELVFRVALYHQMKRRGKDFRLV